MSRFAWDVLDHALEGNRKKVAYRLHVSPSLVNKWCAAPDVEGGEGALSPLQRLVEIVLALREFGSDKGEDLVRYILEELDYMPTVRKAALALRTMEGLADFLKEVSDAVRATSEATRDNDIDLDDAMRMDEEFGEVIEAACAIRQALKARIGELRKPAQPKPFASMSR